MSLSSLTTIAPQSKSVRGTDRTNEYRVSDRRGLEYVVGPFRKLEADLTNDMFAIEIEQNFGLSGCVNSEADEVFWYSL